MVIRNTDLYFSLPIMSLSAFGITGKALPVMSLSGLGMLVS